MGEIRQKEEKNVLWLLDSEGRKKHKEKIQDTMREPKFWEQPSPTIKTNNTLKCLDFAMLTEEGANDLGIQLNTLNP